MNSFPKSGLKPPIPPEASTSIVYHGGNLSAARSLFPEAPEPWLDLSTGINPDAFPVPALDPAIWARLPEPGRLAELELRAKIHYAAHPAAALVAAPGTQALIQLLPRLVPGLVAPRRVGLLGLTYGEYERVWSASGACCHTVETIAALRDCDVAIVVNPNNPDGHLTGPAELVTLAGRMADRGGLLVIDEAFMDVTPPEWSILPSLPVQGAVVLRSFGKAYGLAGVRLGFAVTGDAIADRLRAMLGPWCVSGPAIEIACAAFDDDRWLAASTARLRARAERLDEMFDAAGATLVGGTPLFRLYRHPRAAHLFEHLGQAGILVRHFPTEPNLLRVGIYRQDSDLDRLRQALG